MKDKKIGIITQARFNSSRLPGKILIHVNNKPLLDYHIEKLLQIDQNLIIATVDSDDCSPIRSYAESKNIRHFSGSELNVLERFYKCASLYNLDIIIRVTSDCPFIDPALIKKALDLHISTGDNYTYTSNCIKRTYPRGFDFEIFSIEMLKEAFNNAQGQIYTEHVTQYFVKNIPQKYNFIHITQKDDLSDLRVTLDTPQDLLLIQTLIEKFDAQNLSHTEISDILLKNDDLKRINCNIKQKGL